MTTNQYQSARALEMSRSRQRHRNASKSGVTVAAYNGIYIDADVSPAEAATMLLAAFGREYASVLAEELGKVVGESKP